MRLFEQTFKISDTTRILDVGGSSEIWRFTSVQPRITLLNFPTALAAANCRLRQIAGDGRFLPFQDRSFDIVFSNSVIEHVGTRDDQFRFAEEVGRVGRSYWIQTPNRRFPVEMHLMLPLVQFLPKSTQRSLIYRFTVWEKLVKPSAAERAFYLEHFLNELNLLDRASLAG
ncbi:MAG: methyltransferase domain-containing protein, partial [Acidobacteriaceae bacterium]|nr:methyltransferase domain-containing protein [Acidobacteriaceae bacterium]